MARMLIALAGLLMAAGCGAGSKPPEQLGGLWSAGPAACAAGVGVRFTPSAIIAAYQDQAEILFARPSYDVLDADGAFAVRIEYDLPSRGGAVGGRGVLVLEMAADGSIAPQSHAMLDGRTGAARMRLKDDPVDTLLDLRPCGGARGGAGLRGLTTAR